MEVLAKHVLVEDLDTDVGVYEGIQVSRVSSSPVLGVCFHSQSTAATVVLKRLMMLVASERPWLAKSSEGMMDEYCPWLRYVSDTTSHNDLKANPRPSHLQGVAEQPEEHVHEVAEELGDKGRLPEVSRAAHLGHELC